LRANESGRSFREVALARVKKLLASFGLFAREQAATNKGGSEEESKSTHRKLAEKDKLAKLRRRLKGKNRDLETLRTQLARAQSAARRPNLALERTPIFFVVGRAKSGTSWLMRNLDAHPDILCKGEGRFFGRDLIQEDFKDARRGMRARVQPSSLYRALLEAEYLEAWIERSVWTRGDNVEEHLVNLTRLSTNYFLTQRLLQSGKRIVGDKTPFFSSAILEEIGRIYPEAKVIHVIRDGRDIAVSTLHHRWNFATDEGGIYELGPEELAKREAYRSNPEGLTKPRDELFPGGMLESLATDWKEQVR